MMNEAKKMFETKNYSIYEDTTRSSREDTIFYVYFCNWQKLILHDMIESFDGEKECKNILSVVRKNGTKKIRVREKLSTSHAFVSI